MNLKFYPPRFYKSLIYKGIRNTLLFAMCLLWSAAAYAQAFNVSGVVSDEDGEPMPGVSVIVKGTNNGIATDINGAYSLSVNKGADLVFSYIGCLTKTISVGDRKVINVTMQQDTEALDEVVVVAYGTQKKSSITGAISQVNAKDIETRPVSSVPLPSRVHHPVSP